MEPPDEDIPGRHPEPPDDLHQRSLPIVEIMAPMYRVHGVNHDPLYFGMSKNYRFDAPDGTFGVLYAGDGLACTFIETYGRLDNLSRIVTEPELARRCLSQIQPTTPLRLVDLAGSGLRQIDADNRLCTGAYQVAQRWSMALHAHPNVIDGLRYRSRHDPERVCFALYDRALDRIAVERVGSLDGRSLRAPLIEILDMYGFGML